MVTANAGLSPEERRALLVDYFELLRNAQETAELFEERTGLEAQRAWKHTRFHANEAKRVRDTYMASLDPSPLSRCPFTGDVLELADRPRRPRRPLVGVRSPRSALRAADRHVPGADWRDDDGRARWSARRS